jgi:hypothetical protein
MTLEVETGSGSATAESFASVADCDTYFSLRGLSIWTGLVTAEKEQALRRATDYMQQTYRDSWTGLRTSSTQALDWPRWSVPVRDLPGGYGTGNAYFPNNAVPSEVKTACIMLAIKAAAGELAPDLSSQVASVKVGPIEKTYFQGTRQQVKYQAVDNLLAPFLHDSTRLARA